MYMSSLKAEIVSVLLFSVSPMSEECQTHSKRLLYVCWMGAEIFTVFATFLLKVQEHVPVVFLGKNKLVMTTISSHD